MLIQWNQLKIICDENLLKLHRTLNAIRQRERVSHRVVAFPANYYYLKQENTSKNYLHLIGFFGCFEFQIQIIDLLQFFLVQELQIKWKKKSSKTFNSAEVIRKNSSTCFITCAIKHNHKTRIQCKFIASNYNLPWKWHNLPAFHIKQTS